MNDRFNRFKFRVWNKKTKKMKKVMALISEEGVYYSLMVNENEAVVTPCEEPHMVLMQCTGLKDKNGVLIYEGDIIDIWCCNLLKNQISSVKYCEARAAFMFDYFRDSGDIINCTMEKTEIKVIGNIYETPELLEVK